MTPSPFRKNFNPLSSNEEKGKDRHQHCWEVDMMGQSPLACCNFDSRAGKAACCFASGEGKFALVPAGRTAPDLVPLGAPNERQVLFCMGCLAKTARSARQLQRAIVRLVLVRCRGHRLRQFG